MSFSRIVPYKVRSSQTKTRRNTALEAWAAEGKTSQFLAVLTPARSGRIAESALIAIRRTPLRYRIEATQLLAGQMQHCKT